MPQSANSDYDYRGRPRYPEDVHMHDARERDSAGVPQARRDLGRVDARELVRGAKERAKVYGTGAGSGASPYAYAPRAGDDARDARRKRSDSQESGASSSMSNSIDEMLFESATDRRGREDGACSIL